MRGPPAFNYQVAADLGVCVPAVAKWRGRFIQKGLAGLADEDRPGRPPSILLDTVAGALAADAGGDAEGRDALVAGVDGQAHRPVGVHP